MALFLFSTALGAAPPPFPSGLGNGEGTREAADESTHWKEKIPFDLNGFLEGRFGRRLQNDSTQKKSSVAETRLQLQAEKNWDLATINITSDFIYDSVEEDHSIDLDTGQGWIDLREANFFVRPTSYADLKVGRQVLTWGTGDLLFINDLFPKDWNSFFVGRDEEYLKAPSDSLKLALFKDIVNLDVVYTPRFDSDRYIDGRRISYLDGASNSVVGRNKQVAVKNRTIGLLMMSWH